LIFHGDTYRYVYVYRKLRHTMLLGRITAVHYYILCHITCPITYMSYLIWLDFGFRIMSTFRRIARIIYLYSVHIYIIHYTRGSNFRVVRNFYRSYKVFRYNLFSTTIYIIIRNVTGFCGHVASSWFLYFSNV